MANAVMATTVSRQPLCLAPQRLQTSVAVVSGRCTVDSSSQASCSSRCTSVSLNRQVGVSSRACHNYGSRSHRHCPKLALVVCTAAASTPEAQQAEQHENDDDDLFDMGLGGSDEAEEINMDLPKPEVRHQRKLGMKDIKVLRARGNTLARDKELVNVQLGQKGLTQNVLTSIMDVLEKHEFVRVKMGEGCGYERGALAAALETYLDCLSVHEIGFTITLYRQKGLPRPSNTVRTTSAAEDDDELVSSAPQPAPSGSQTSQAKTSRKMSSKAKRAARQAKPPEFTAV